MFTSFFPSRQWRKNILDVRKIKITSSCDCTCTLTSPSNLPRFWVLNFCRNAIKFLRVNRPLNCTDQSHSSDCLFYFSHFFVYFPLRVNFWSVFKVMHKFQMHSSCSRIVGLSTSTHCSKHLHNNKRNKLSEHSALFFYTSLVDAVEGAAAQAEIWFSF